MVGSDGDDDFDLSSGAAYIFERDASGTWTERQKLTASNASAGDRFATSLSLNESTLAIGASATEVVYIFELDPDTGLWSEVAQLPSPDPAFAWFGSAVSLAGDLLVVGAGQDNEGGLASTSSNGSQAIALHGSTWRKYSIRLRAI